eukprot:3362567-Prymnesium_polylepis.1
MANVHRLDRSAHVPKCRGASWVAVPPPPVPDSASACRLATVGNHMRRPQRWQPPPPSTTPIRVAAPLCSTPPKPQARDTARARRSTAPCRDAAASDRALNGWS